MTNVLSVLFCLRSMQQLGYTWESEHGRDIFHTLDGILHQFLVVDVHYLGPATLSLEAIQAVHANSPCLYIPCEYSS